MILGTPLSRPFRACNLGGLVDPGSRRDFVGLALAALVAKRR
jgi:hypothetical protein